MAEQHGPDERWSADLTFNPKFSFSNRHTLELWWNVCPHSPAAVGLLKKNSCGRVDPGQAGYQAEQKGLTITRQDRHRDLHINQGTFKAVKGWRIKWRGRPKSLFFSPYPIYQHNFFMGEEGKETEPREWEVHMFLCVGKHVWTSVGWRSRLQGEDYESGMQDTPWPRCDLRG